MVRDHRPPDHLPRRLAQPLLPVIYQSDIILIDDRIAETTATGGILMNAPNHNTGAGRLRRWWFTPPRPGLQRIIAPWEYRHLRGFARVRIAAGIVLVGLSAVTLVGGSFTAEAVGWAMLFLAFAAASFAWAAWDLAIARSASART
jgi:hypothetical protein